MSRVQAEKEAFSCFMLIAFPALFLFLGWLLS